MVDWEGEGEEQSGCYDIAQDGGMYWLWQTSATLGWAVGSKGPVQCTVGLRTAVE